ncbi:LacI family DNA-binding transcriptional regulator [Endozoicomonas atrinae]|uniref:LacI family DNA-binding transcriptional regulator n=1 Tax=Endozoicomonas atrinae TaxID=1333660 RepID=UPI003AFF715A
MSTEQDESSQNPQVTIHHVAACAGLSIASVSRALNGEKYVSEKTRQKVMDAVRELNYQPNYVARQMHRQKQFSIGVVLGKDAGTYAPFAMKVYESLQAPFQQRGYRARQAQFLKNGKLKDTSAGYITIGLHESDPRYEVMHNSSSIVLDIGEARKSGLWVSSNDQQGGYLATQHLIESGCRDIHFICLHEKHRVSRFRYHGYLDAIRQHGLTVYEPIAVGDDAGTPALDTYRSLTRLFHAGLKADGFVCFADTLATGACSAASDFGLKIPDDLSVIGYDGIVGYGNIDLSSIRQDIDGLADSAAELLIDAMKSGEMKGRSLDVSLTAGKTTRPHKSIAI